MSCYQSPLFFFRKILKVENVFWESLFTFFFQLEASCKIVGKVHYVSVTYVIPQLLFNAHIFEKEVCTYLIVIGLNASSHGVVVGLGQFLYSSCTWDISDSIPDGDVRFVTVVV